MMTFESFKEHILDLTETPIQILSADTLTGVSVGELQLVKWSCSIKEREARLKFLYNLHVASTDTPEDCRGVPLEVGDTVLSSRVVGKVIGINPRTHKVKITRERMIGYLYSSPFVTVYTYPYNLTKVFLPEVEQ